MVIYKLEKSNDLMLLLKECDIETSLFFVISPFNLLLNKMMAWYFWRPVLTAARIEVNSLEQWFVEHLEAPVIQGCIYGP